MASAFNVARIPAKLRMVGDGVVWAANCDQANLAKAETGSTAAKFILAEGVALPALEDRLPAISGALMTDESADCGLLHTGPERSDQVTRLGKSRQRCNVSGCQNQVQGKYVQVADSFGAKGPMCKRHGSVIYRCEIPGCQSESRRRLPADEHGEEGRRCIRHGAPRPRKREPKGDSVAPVLRVAERKRKARRFFITCVGKCAWVFDGYPLTHWGQGESYHYIEVEIEEGATPEFREITPEEKNVIGSPYLGHFAGPSRKKRMCSIDGCGQKSQGSIVDEESNAVKPVCYRHGAYRRKCSVHGRTSSAQGRKVPLSEGPDPVDICAKHGGGKTRCVVHGCASQAQGMGASRSDDNGGVRPRCR